MTGVRDRGFERQWKSETGIDWGELTESRRGTFAVEDDTADGAGLTLVLIDEGKLLYDSGMSDSSSFWAAVKIVLQGGGNTCIVMAATYAGEVRGLPDASPSPPYIEGLESVSLW